MGSEHSSQRPQSGGQRSFDDSSIPREMYTIRRQQTIANPGGSSDPSEMTERPGSTSPGPSVCSDIDLPYISYTVNRPIGDSPQFTNKQKLKSAGASFQQQRASSLAQRSFGSPKTSSKKTAHNIVVVKAAQSGPGIDKDPDIVRLQRIPMFLPIMRATLNLPAARDPEVLERLDPVPLQKLCSRYQTHMHTCANLVATDQNQMTQRIREIDADIAKMVQIAFDRHKQFGKHYEKLRKVTELSHQLNKCHNLLNQTLESMETLNNFLDLDDRLEPFVWTTG